MYYILKTLDGTIRSITQPGKTLPRTAVSYFAKREDAKPYRDSLSKVLKETVYISRSANHPRGESSPERQNPPGTPKTSRKRYKNASDTAFTTDTTVTAKFPNG